MVLATLYVHTRPGLAQLILIQNTLHEWKCTAAEFIMAQPWISSSQMLIQSIYYTSFRVCQEVPLTQTCRPNRKRCSLCCWCSRALGGVELLNSRIMKSQINIREMFIVHEEHQDTKHPPQKILERWQVLEGCRSEEMLMRSSFAKVSLETFRTF